MTTLHSLRQQLADAVNARDVARVREHAADARAAASETRRVAAEASAAETAAAAALEIESLRKSLDLNQQVQLEMQQLLQRKDTEFAETLGSSAAEVVSLSATLHELQQSYRYSRAACIVFDCCLFFAVLHCNSSKKSKAAALVQQRASRQTAASPVSKEYPMRTRFQQPHRPCRGSVILNRRLRIYFPHRRHKRRQTATHPPLLLISRQNRMPHSCGFTLLPLNCRFQL